MYNSDELSYLGEYFYFKYSLYKRLEYIIK